MAPCPPMIVPPLMDRIPRYAFFVDDVVMIQAREGGEPKEDGVEKEKASGDTRDDEGSNQL